MSSIISSVCNISITHVHHFTLTQVHFYKSCFIRPNQLSFLASHLPSSSKKCDFEQTEERLLFWLFTWHSSPSSQIHCNVQKHMNNCGNYTRIQLMSHYMKLWERAVGARLRWEVTMSEQQVASCWERAPQMWGLIWECWWRRLEEVRRIFTLSLWIRGSRWLAADRGAVLDMQDMYEDSLDTDCSLRLHSGLEKSCVSLGQQFRKLCAHYIQVIFSCCILNKNVFMLIDEFSQLKAISTMFMRSQTFSWFLCYTNTILIRRLSCWQPLTWF